MYVWLEPAKFLDFRQFWRAVDERSKRFPFLAHDLVGELRLLLELHGLIGCRNILNQVLLLLPSLRAAELRLDLHCTSLVLFSVALVDDHCHWSRLRRLSRDFLHRLVMLLTEILDKHKL